MAKQPRSLHGKVAVVTGGGRGIGKALALALAREGCRVGIGDVDAASAETAAAELGGDAVGLPLDVTDRPGFTAFLDEVESRLGPIDVLVNNAGIMPVGPLDQEDDAAAIRLLEINLHAVIHGTKEAMRRMKPRGTGPYRQRRLDRRQVHLPQPRHLLRHEARRGRAVGGGARRAPRHRRRGVGRDAGDRQDRAVDRSRR